MHFGSATHRARHLDKSNVLNNNHSAKINFQEAGFIDANPAFSSKNELIANS